jgi:hypothetical protein
MVSNVFRELVSHLLLDLTFSVPPVHVSLISSLLLPPPPSSSSSSSSLCVVFFIFNYYCWCLLVTFGII